VALLRDVPRTATVTAATPVVAYELDREAFLTAVTGHDIAREAAHVIVEERLRDEDPGAKPHQPDEEHG
jgi:CRP-like cAMP-binding protein